MQLSDAENLARALMRQHGLAGWSYALNRRKRSLGLCRYTARRIELSVYFVLHHPEQQVREVILHEIAHALAGHAAAHGPRWRAICQTIGARPKRCSDARMPAGRWNATCPACRRQYNRIRRPFRNRRYNCPQCGPEQGKLLFRAT